jgi:hypothetical protein
LARSSRSQGRGQGARRRRQDEGRHPLLGRQLDPLHLLQLLDAGLRLGGLRRLGLEPVDELLQVRPLGLLLGLGRLHEAQLFGPRLFEGVVVAGVELQLAVRQVQDVGADLVQHLAVVADDQRGRRILLQPRLQPQRAFQIEVVGRFVQQQHVRLGEQRRRKRHAHAPAAREMRHRPVQVLLTEAETDQDFRRPGRRGVGVDLDEPGPDFAHLLGFRGLQPAQQLVPLHVGFEDRLQHADGRGRMFLIH